MRAGPALSRRSAAALLLGTAGVLAAATAATWLEVATWTPLADTTVPVSGGRAAPAVGAAAFVVATGAVALALARGWGRLVALVGVGLGGLLAVLSTAPVLLDPQGVAEAAARAAVGVGVTTGPPTLTLAPWVALAMGVAGLGLAALAAGASGQWPAPTARHEPEAGVESGGPTSAGPADQWDAFTRGEDPTG